MSRNNININRKHSEDIDMLKQCFGLPQEVVESVYTSFQSNFEKAYKALSDMQQSDEDQKRNRLTPEIKLNFLSVVFDKLTKSFVETTLNKYKWSVEASIDDLLNAEENRAKVEEEQRQRIEAERQRREAEQRLQEQQHREEIERNNKYFYLQALFPRLDRNYVLHVLQTYQWNTDEAYQFLYQIEQRRQYDEEQERLYRIEQARLLEEKQLKEQEERLKKEAEEMKSEQIEQVIAGATNWDQIYANFLKRVKEVENDSEIPETQKEIVNEQQAMVEITKDIVPFLNDGEIVQVFNEKNWEVDKSLPVLEDISKQKFQKRVEQVYPNLSPEEIGLVVQESFPDDSEAIERLRPLATHREMVKNLEMATASAKQRLEEANERLQKFELERKETLKKQQNRLYEMEKLSGVERNVFNSAHEMVQQREDVKLEEMSKKYAIEVSKAEQEYKEALEKLNKEKQQGPPTAYQNNKNWKPKSPGERRTVFNKFLAERKATYKKDREDHQIARQNIIAQKLFKELGHHRFGALQEAIGRAPGGVARGYSGPDYVHPSEQHSSTVSSTPPVIETPNQLSVADCISKLETTGMFQAGPHTPRSRANVQQTDHTVTQPPQRPTTPVPDAPRQYVPQPTQIPTQQQTQNPTQQQPFQIPTHQQSQNPIQQQPFQISTHQQSQNPIQQQPFQISTQHQTQNPTQLQPFQIPTQQQTQNPTQQPYQIPTHQQTQNSTQQPYLIPTHQQTPYPTQHQIPPHQQTQLLPTQQQYQFPTQQQLPQPTQQHLTPSQINLILLQQQQAQQSLQQQQQFPYMSSPFLQQNPAQVTMRVQTDSLNLSAQEIHTYDTLFQLASKDKFYVTMADAQFLHYSCLENEILSQIWSLASCGENKLTRQQFFIALRLISQAQNKIPLSLDTIKNPLPVPIFHLPVYPNPTQFQGGSPLTTPYYNPPPQGTQVVYPGVTGGNPMSMDKVAAGYTQPYPGSNVRFPNTKT